MGYFVIYIVFLLMKSYLLADYIHFSKWLPTCKYEKENRVSSFETVASVSVKSCIDLCKTSKRCEYFNYNMRFKLCSLLGLIDIIEHQSIKQDCLSESMTGYVYGNKSEWDMEGYETCQGCNYHGVCYSTDNNTKCRTSGCSVPVIEINAVTIYGNMYDIGDKVNFKCNDAFDLKILDSPYDNQDVVTAVCDTNGSWTYPNFTCEPKRTELRNVAHGKPVTLSSLYSDISHGYLMVDGVISHAWPCACTKREYYPWAVIDLGLNYAISHMFFANRFDCCSERLHDLKIYVGISESSFKLVHSRKASVGKTYTVTFDDNVSGRYVKLQIEAVEILTICELEIYSLVPV